MRRFFVAAILCCAWSAALAGGAGTEVTYLDLQPQANQKLTENFHDVTGNTYKELPQGEQTLGGVKFKIGEGAILLAGEFVPDLPEKVEGIQVKKAFRKLHILHATAYAAPVGTLIGEYVVQYEDGSAEAIPIVYGEDVRDQWNNDQSKPVTRGKLAWTGENDAVKQRNKNLRLYLTTWQNPKPDKRVVRIDYLSKMTRSAPFCIAMTLETR
jgi:hypothetical protein